MTQPNTATAMPAKAQAMILAAGRGERMRPLTDSCPKPLLRVHGKPLMQRPMEALGAAGFCRQLVNTAWLGEQIETYFTSFLDGSPANPLNSLLLKSERLQIAYSHEGVDFGYALETAGGICRALPRLVEEFWLVAGDIYAPTFEFSCAAYAQFAASSMLAHIWLVPNPAHNPRGDFGLSTPGEGAGGIGYALNLPKDAGHTLYTYSTIGLYKHGLFAPPYCTVPEGNPQGTALALAPLLRAAMDAGLVSAQLFTGEWADVGTPERLKQLNL